LDIIINFVISFMDENWAMLYNKISNTGKISAKKDFGF
jgi:hypothetical protein